MNNYEGYEHIHAAFGSRPSFEQGFSALALLLPERQLQNLKKIVCIGSGYGVFEEVLLTAHFPTAQIVLTDIESTRPKVKKMNAKAAAKQHKDADLFVFCYPQCSSEGYAPLVDLIKAPILFIGNFCVGDHCDPQANFIDNIRVIKKVRLSTDTRFTPHIYEHIVLGHMHPGIFRHLPEDHPAERLYWDDLVEETPDVSKIPQLTLNPAYPW